MTRVRTLGLCFLGPRLLTRLLQRTQHCRHTLACTAREGGEPISLWTGDCGKTLNLCHTTLLLSLLPFCWADSVFHSIFPDSSALPVPQDQILPPALMTADILTQTTRAE